MIFNCPECGMPAGMPPYTCGHCGAVIVLCSRCQGDGVLYQPDTPARPVRPAPAPVDAPASVDAPKVEP